MSTEKSPYCTCLVYTTNALSRIITRLSDEEFASTGLSSSYAFLLMTVHNNPGITATDIAVKMMLTPSTVTRLVDKLEKQGLVRRINDGRYILVYATKAGNELFPAVQVAWRNIYRRYTEILGEETARELTAATYHAAIKLED